MWTQLGADRRNAWRLLLIIAIVALFVASFAVGFEFYNAPDKAAGAIYPVMTSSGLAYTTGARAVISWAKFVLFGLLFLLQLKPRKGSCAN